MILLHNRRDIQMETLSSGGETKRIAVNNESRGTDGSSWFSVGVQAKSLRPTQDKKRKKRLTRIKA